MRDRAPYPVGPGDVDANGTIDVADVFELVNVLFADQVSEGALDANGDGVASVADVFYLINHIFAGGPPPARAATGRLIR